MKTGKWMIQTGTGKMIKRFAASSFVPMSGRSAFVLLALSLCSVQGKSASYSLSLPSTYTAMEGDLSADFLLDHGPASSFDGATIHLHYLPGDSFLDSFRKTDSSVLLSSQAVPLGSQGGNVIFPCGTVTHAGPHRAYLTILRNSSLYGGLRRVTVAKSRILYVSWPQMSLSVPEKLETYSLNVDIRISFTRNLCSSLLRVSDEERVRSSNLIFAPRLELIECSKSLVNPYAQDCQLSNEAKIWFSETLPPNFYQRAAMEVSINCSFWGQEGTFRTFLRTDLSHAPIIARSKPIVVERNPVYALSSNYKSIYPCLKNDIKPLKVDKPFCASLSDRIQVYGQVYTLSGNNLIVPSDHWKYLGSQLVPEISEESAHIPCEFFSKEFLQVCFRYVSYSIIGTSNVTESLCLPTEEIDRSIDIPSWSSWSEWSSCSTHCRHHKEDPKGFRSRHRYCQFPQGDDDTKHVMCEGSPVERVEDCGQSLCEETSLTSRDSFREGNKRIYDEEESEESPCSCGCIYLVQEGSRRLIIRSRSSCFGGTINNKPRPLHWKIKTNRNHTLSATASLEEFECPGSWFNFRQGSSLNDDIINQMKIPKHNNSINSNSNFLTIELTPGPNNHKNDRKGSARANCDFLLFVEVVKKKEEPPRQPPATSLDDSHHRFGSFLVSAVHYLSFAGIVFLSIVSVCLSCFICLIFQFEHRRKKYMDWQATSSGYGSSDEEENMELIPHAQPETSHESLPLLPSSSANRKWWGGALYRNLKLRREEEKRASLRRRSLQDLSLFPPGGSPPPSGDEAGVGSPLGGSVITPDQITRAIYHAAALEDKRKKVKYRMKPPEGTPLLSKKSAEKRKSRSVSDITSLISFKLPSEESPPITNMTKLQSQEEDAISTTSTLRPSSVIKSTASSSIKTASVRVPKRFRVPHRNSDLSSVSSFLSSRHSLDLEYDLYDCHLENVSSFPGSNFIAENYWVFDESDLEGIQLMELFPKEEEDTKTLVRQDVDALTQSMTSDLTASMVSRGSLLMKGREDCMNISGYHSGEDFDGLEGVVHHSLLPPKKGLLNITHIDEEDENSGTCV